VIEGKHEEKADEHGFISRQFVRRYMLPEDVKQEEVQCSLSSDGVLMVNAPRETKEALANEKKIPIMQTGQPAITKNPKPDEAGDVPKKE
jgi:crystallin alpha B